jgi:uncharacterized membrane protein YdjX (TVP38/TMEM64 family)
MASFRRNLLRGILLVSAVLLVVWIVRITDARQILRVVLEKIQNLGPYAPLYFIGAYVVACLTFFPGIILTLGGGVLFGVFKGTLYVSVGATIGASCAFLVSRYLFRDWLSRKFAGSPRFRAIDDAVARDGWKVVGLIRLSPAFPFVPLNFVFGLTRIPLLHFALVTWVSLLPLTAMFVYLGSLLGDIAAIGSRPIVSGQTKWVVSGVGVVMTIVVTLVVTRLAKQALAGRLPDEVNGAPADRAASE